MSKLIRELKQARQLIVDGWCKKSLAKCYFIPVNFDSPYATSYCAMGAVYKEVEQVDRVRKFMQKLVYEVTSFNDDPHTKKEDVLRLFDSTIAYFEELEARVVTPQEVWA